MENFSLWQPVAADLDPPSSSSAFRILFLFLFLSCSRPRLYFYATHALLLKTYMVDSNGFHFRLRFSIAIFDCDF